MKVTCVVDDAVLPGSGLTSEHGLSILVEHAERRVLFDTGASGKILLKNLSRLGVDPESLSAVVLSHAHQDHTGGLAMLLERTPDVPVYAHPDLFTQRLSLRGTRLKDVSLPISRATMIIRVNLHLDSEPVEVIPKVWTTGSITERPDPEGRSERHFVRIQGHLAPDPYTDDISLALELDDGVALVCGCCHAGILNVIRHVDKVFGRPIRAIFGGLHLEEADEAYLGRVVEVLKEHGAPRLFACHCTGQKAVEFFKSALGEEAVVPFPAGASYSFEETADV